MNDEVLKEKQPHRGPANSHNEGEGAEMIFNPKECNLDCGNA